MKKDLKKQCAEKIRSLVPNIDTGDKSKASYELSISRPTLDKYLSGDISKIDTAITIINYFTRVVDRRKKNLTAA